MNLYLILIALIWAVYCSQFFGWHWHPKSAAELVCDGIGVLILAMAFQGVPS